MNSIYFTTAKISGENENNVSFYLTVEEAKKDTDAKLQEEIRCIQKLINDYKLKMPILSGILKNLKIEVNIREYMFQENKTAS